MIKDPECPARNAKNFEFLTKICSTRCYISDMKFENTDINCDEFNVS